MAIDDPALDKLAFLARLTLPNEGRGALRAELERMLDFVATLQAADVDGVEPMAHPADSHVALRADVVTETDRSEALLALAPSASAGLFVVPKVIE